MAEFSEVMRQWKRMCESMSSCENCPLAIEDIAGGYMCRNGITSLDYKSAETVIMRWATDNPEPVYPRWCDWLAEQGVLVCDNSFPNMRYWYAMNTEKMEQPIPADIAQKLGLEPKEE